MWYSGKPPLRQGLNAVTELDMPTARERVCLPREQHVQRQDCVGCLEKGRRQRSQFGYTRRSTRVKEIRSQKTNHVENIRSML